MIRNEGGTAIGSNMALSFMRVAKAVSGGSQHAPPLARPWHKLAHSARFVNQCAAKPSKLLVSLHSIKNGSSGSPALPPLRRCGYKPHNCYSPGSCGYKPHLRWQLLFPTPNKK